MKNLLIGLVVGILTGLFFNFKKENPLKVSLPEEINIVKGGELLQVEKVSDSIYIGFKNY